MNAFALKNFLFMIGAIYKLRRVWKVSLHFGDRCVFVKSLGEIKNPVASLNARVKLGCYFFETINNNQTVALET